MVWYSSVRGCVLAGTQRFAHTKNFFADVRFVFMPLQAPCDVVMSRGEVKNLVIDEVFLGVPDWNRTSGLSLRSASLYPTELRVRSSLQSSTAPVSGQAVESAA